MKVSWYDIIRSRLFPDNGIQIPKISFLKEPGVATNMVVMSTASVSNVPDTNSAIFKDVSAVLYNPPHVFKICLIFFLVRISPLVEVRRTTKDMIYTAPFSEQHYRVSVS